MRGNDTPNGPAPWPSDGPLRLPAELAPNINLLTAALQELEVEVPGGLYNLAGASLRIRRRVLAAMLAIRADLRSSDASTKARFEALLARMPGNTGGLTEYTEHLDKLIDGLHPLVWWRLSNPEEQDEAFACLQVADAEVAALEGHPGFDRMEVRRHGRWGMTEAELDRVMDNLDPRTPRRRWFEIEKAAIEDALDDSLETVGPYAPWSEIAAARQAERWPAKPLPSPRRGRGRPLTRDDPEWHQLTAWVDGLTRARSGERWTWKAEWELVREELNRPERADLKRRWGRLVPENPDSWADKRRKDRH